MIGSPTEQPSTFPNSQDSNRKLDQIDIYERVDLRLMEAQGQKPFSEETKSAVAKESDHQSAEPATSSDFESVFLTGWQQRISVTMTPVHLLFGPLYTERQTQVSLLLIVFPRRRGSSGHSPSTISIARISSTSTNAERNLERLAASFVRGLAGGALTGKAVRSGTRQQRPILRRSETYTVTQCVAAALPCMKAEESRAKREIQRTRARIVCVRLSQVFGRLAK